MKYKAKQAKAALDHIKMNMQKLEQSFQALEAPLIEFQKALGLAGIASMKAMRAHFDKHPMKPR